MGPLPPLIACVGLALVGGSASPAGAGAARVAVCVSAHVHYEPGPDRDLRFLPWVSAGRRGREIVGYLFFYTPELRKESGLTIYTSGRLPEGGSTKVLWVPRRAGSSLLTIRGERLDRSGWFEQEHRSARGPSGTVFPSIVDVPDAGCWRLTVRNGRVLARFAVTALPASQ